MKKDNGFYGRSPWHEEKGIIHFSVTSDGTNGEEWTTRLVGNKADYVNPMLRSSSFVPTSGVTYEIAILKGILFENENLCGREIRKEAGRRGLTTPNAEIACLIQEFLMLHVGRAMGLRWVVTMHESIKDASGIPNLLSSYLDDDDTWMLYSSCDSSSYDDPGVGWGPECGFAFISKCSAPGHRPRAL
jgi:hypothetical protein